MSCWGKFGGDADIMNQRLATAVGKLAVAGEQAGFSLEQMIQLLNDGLTVESLLELITWRLTEAKYPITSRGCAAHWVV